MNNPLLQTLQIIEILGFDDGSLDFLMSEFDIAPATVKRYLAEARLLGADIVSFRSGPGWVYELRNWPAIKARTLRWIELEKTRSLL